MLAEIPVAELCRKYSIHDAQFYKGNKETIEARKKSLAGDTTRVATSNEIKALLAENRKRKETVTELVILYKHRQTFTKEEEHLF